MSATLRNRIALLQKEEERARKKIDQTKDRAHEILAMRDENERRMHAFIAASDEEKALQRELQERNKLNEVETKQALALQSQKILAKRKEEAHLLNLEKRNMTKLLIREQESELRLKQQKREEVRKMEEMIRLKRDMERAEQERRIREQYEKKAAAEEAEARRAEKLVRALEMKEKAWMTKLAEAQLIQEAAFGHLEYSLLRDEQRDRERDGGSSSIASPASEMLTDVGSFTNQNQDQGFNQGFSQGPNQAPHQTYNQSQNPAIRREVKPAAGSGAKAVRASSGGSVNSSNNAKKKLPSKKP
jgi:hypothetical protein